MNRNQLIESNSIAESGRLNAERELAEAVRLLRAYCYQPDMKEKSYYCADCWSKFGDDHGPGCEIGNFLAHHQEKPDAE